MNEFTPQTINTPWGDLELAGEADVRRCLASKELLAAARATRDLLRDATGINKPLSRLEDAIAAAESGAE